MRHRLFFIFLLICSIAQSQQSHFFRTVYFPAEPFGGAKELKEFIKLEMQYPENALKEEIEGEAFITFKVDNSGQVIYKEVATNVDEQLQKEAERIFDKIMWEKDPKRNNEELGFEKLSIKFNAKKYQKLAKKRGFDRHPILADSVSQAWKAFNINQVDVKPTYSMALSYRDFIKENFVYPSIALQQNISGRVTVEFIVEPYGLASNIRVIEPVGGGCNEETKRLVRLMSWNPAIKEGKAVRCKVEYQLNFVNPGGTIR